MYSLGYDENRFEIVVSERFHCPICFQVLKDPVMCKNQHSYCSPCIKKYLKDKASCPTCRVPLSVDTLSDARIVRDYLSELNIRCDFYDRECREMVQVGQLKRHVANCGFAPVPCSNDGCNLVLSKRDKLHHEAEVCDFRRLKCHDCGELKKEVKEVKEGMKEMRVELESEMKGMKDDVKNEMKGVKDELKNEMQGMEYGVRNELKKEMEVMKNEMKDEIKNRLKETTDDMKIKVKEMKEEVKSGFKDELKEMKDEVKNEVKATSEEIANQMKKIKEEMKREMKEVIMSAVRETVVGIKDPPKDETKNSKQSLKAPCLSEARANIVGREREEGLGQMKERVVNEARVEMAGKKGRSEASCSSEARGSIFVAGGFHREGPRLVMNKPTEYFNWADQTWRRLNPAAVEGRRNSCSFLYQGQMVVAGGYDDVSRTNTVKCLNLADPAATWKDFHVNLPVKCSDHKVVNCGDRLYMSGGLVQATDGGLVKCSDAVYEVQLVPPFSSKMLTRLRRPRSGHGMELYDQKLFILGGYDGKEITNSVVQYDLIKNECKEMPPLPYVVQEMATVLWRNNVLVLSGRDAGYNALNTVVMYDVITGRSQMLPCMKRQRLGCTAVLTGNVVVVMGGVNEGNEYLKSVECFDLERQVWQDLPDMLEGRVSATAVVRPNH